MMTEYRKIRQKILFTYLDKYPDTATRQITRMVCRDNPLIFIDFEETRSMIRYYRGADGKTNRNKNLSTKKYMKNV